MSRESYNLKLIVSLCLFFGAAGAAHAQRQQVRLALQALDLDRDGILSAGEIKAAPTSLLTLDRNGDGAITSDELSPLPPGDQEASDDLVVQLMSYDKASKGYLVLGDLPERMQPIFIRADANHDGKLTHDEIVRANSRQGPPTGPAASPERAIAMFRQDPLLNALDTNHDGMLSAAEISSASTSLLALDKNGDGELTPDEFRMAQPGPEAQVNHMIEENDTDKDGKLSRAEAPEYLAAQFDSIDANHDGFLDKAELTAFFGKQGQQGGRGPDGPRQPGGEQKPQ